jgi:tetratricopeptide (TPR) repeat protein
MRVLKAPFKAIGRLFGRGNKDDNKLHRLSEKDVQKFESAQVSRIVDARTAPSVPTTNASAAAPGALSTEHPSAAGDANQILALQHLANGRELLQSNELNRAIDAFSIAASIDPKLREAHNLLGVAYELKGLRNLALLSLETAVKDKKDNAEHLNNFGYLLSKNGEYERGAKYLKRAVRLAPNEQRYWNNLGVAQVQLGKFDDAYKSFEKAVGEFEGRLNVATRLQRVGNDKEAIKHLEKARTLRPNTPDILARLIVLYGRTANTEAAAEARTSLVALQASANASGQQQ